MAFLPDAYEFPSNGDARQWFKPDTGITTVRILGNCITGTEYWEDKIPHRVMKPKEVPRHIDDAKHFWMVPIAVNGDIQIWTITQTSIQKQIFALQSSNKWGDPTGYDIDIKREGSGLQTRYTVTPNPKEKLDTGLSNRYKTWARTNNLLDIAFSNSNEEPTVTETEDELPF
jgi:hypothetical protein